MFELIISDLGRTLCYLLLSLTTFGPQNMSLGNIVEYQNTAPLVPSTKTVEGNLWRTCKLLAVAEGNIYLLNTLQKLGIATNDISNFIEKQIIHMKVNKFADDKARRTLMRSKLIDACAFARRLRQDKNTIRKRVLRKYSNNKAQGKKIVKDIQTKYRQKKALEFENVDKKIVHLKNKNELKKAQKDAPDSTKEILNGVNFFSEESKSIKSEEPA